MKLLLVDDDSFLRDMYAQKFSEAGHEVSSAKDGNEALTVLEDNTFDVILLDMIMPGLTGVGLIEKICETHDDMPKCIVLSNQGEQTDIDAATKAGAIGYIIKAESLRGGTESPFGRDESYCGIVNHVRHRPQNARITQDGGA